MDIIYENCSFFKVLQICCRPTVTQLNMNFLMKNKEKNQAHEELELHW